MRPEGIEAIEKDGPFVVDFDGEYVTPLVNEKECAYTIFDPNGMAKCGLEEGFNQGLILWCSLWYILLPTPTIFRFRTYHYNNRSTFGYTTLIGWSSTSMSQALSCSVSLICWPDKQVKACNKTAVRMAV